MRRLKIACVAVLVLVSVVPARLQAAPVNAALLGPYGGAIEAGFVIDPETGTAFAATQQGVFRSVDGGTTWHPHLAGLTNLYVKDIELSGSDLFVATLGGHVFKSAKGSAPWVRLDPSLWMTRMLATSPAAPGILYAWGDLAVGETAVVRSRDGGLTWKRMSTHSTEGTDWEVSALEVSPSEPDFLYMSRQSGLYRSADAGRSWTRSDNPPGARWFSSMAIHPKDSLTVYWSGDNFLYMSVDGGSSWNELDGWSGEAPFVLVALSDPDVVYLTVRGRAEDDMPHVHRVARSDDGGQTWRDLSAIRGRIWTPRVAVDPKDSSRLLAGTWGHGIFRSTDGGESWTEANEGLTAASAFRVVIDPVLPTRILSVLQASGLFRSDTAGFDWTRMGSDLGDPENPFSDVFITDLILEPGPDPLLFAGRLAPDGDADRSAIMRSSDLGASWEGASGDLSPAQVNSSWEEGTIVGDLEDDPRSSGSAYVALTTSNSEGGLFHTNDGGDSWVEIGPAGLPFRKLEVHWRTGRIYASVANRTDGGNRALYRSDDWGASWTKLPYPFADRAGVADLAVGHDADVVYAASRADSRVARSFDGGRSWVESRFGNNHPGNVHAVAVDPLNPWQVFAGTDDQGIWVSVDKGATWAALTPGVTDLRTHDLVFLPLPAFGGDAGRTSNAAEKDVPLYGGMAGRARGGVWKVIPAPSAKGRPRIEGKRKVGARLKCEPRKWVRTDRLKFRWIRSGKVIKNATGRRYMLRSSDAGHRIRCRVVGKGPGGRRAVHSKWTRIPT